jgi:ketosteroid isomerase-like protein
LPPVQRRFPAEGSARVRQLAGRSIIAAAALTAAPGQSSWADPTEAVQLEIRSALEKWRSAFNEQNGSQVCDIFASDLVANYQGAPERDYASLCQLLQTAVQDPEKTYHYSLNINEILVYGDAAVVRLVWTLEIEQAGMPKQTAEETAVDIFRHQGDGSWKISRYLAYPASP